MRTHREITEAILGHAIDSQGYAPCPGAHLHTTGNSAHDFRVFFDDSGAQFPWCHCFHASCRDARRAFLSALYAAIHAERRAGSPPAARRGGSSRLPAAPEGRRAPVRELDPARALSIANKCPHEITEAWLRQHSPVAIPAAPAKQALLLLDSLYAPGERILIFTRYRSQGQFIRVAGRGSYRLGREPGVRAVPSPRLPMGGEEGVWFLSAPVTGLWEPNPNRRDAAGHIASGRRHAACCTRFPFAVLESDVLPPEVWLRILVQIREPIVAVYSSGGKRHHALVRVDAATEEEFTAIRQDFVRRFAQVGADPAAITAVRLTRLPGCYRYGKTGADGAYSQYPRPRLQELLYLNPVAGKQPIA